MEPAIDLIQLALHTTRPKSKRGHIHEDKFYFSLSGSFVYLRSNARNKARGNRSLQKTRELIPRRLD